MRSKIILILSVLILAVSCRTKYVSIPEYHTEYITKTDSITQRDSVYVKDSICTWMRGDTIYKEKFSVIYKDRWRDRYLCDTIIKTDSVRVPYPVERDLSPFERFKLAVGGYSSALVGIVIVVIFIRIVRRLSRK